jgi:4-oxalmesaconate hydratase
MIIDVHGHYTTAPAALGAWRDRQVAALKNPSEAPRASDLRIGDDELRESIESNQLAKMKERGLDLTIFSPRASFMAHHIGGFPTSAAWAAICNELCFRVAQLFPDHLVKNILFASEMIGAVRGIDPTTGHHYDDTKRYVEATSNLSAQDRHLVYEGNARRVFPRLDSRLKQKGL